MAVVPTLVAEPDTQYELTVVARDRLRAAICAVGEFDLAARNDLADVLRQQEDARRRIVRLDLSKVTFLDCSCLGVLVAAHHRLLELHGLLVVTGVDKAIARIIRITGLDDTFFIVPADQDPFSAMVARLARRRRFLEQRLPVLASGGSSMATADQLEPANLFGPPRWSGAPDTPARDPRRHDWRPGNGRQ